jgi:hypothetical protein
MVASGVVLTGREVLASDQPLSHIVPLPYSSNIEIGREGLETHLSVLSRMALDSAVQVWEHHPSAKIVIAGETDYDGLPNTTDLTVQRAQEISEVGEDSILPLHVLPDGRALNNTYLQMKAVADSLGVDNVGQKVLFIPLGPHLKRVMQVARAYGLSPGFATAEDILSEAGIPEYEDCLPIVAELERSERIKRFVGRVDKKGALFNLMARIAGPMIVDVVEAKEGPRLEQRLARPKQKSLQQSLDLVKARRAY